MKEFKEIPHLEKELYGRSALYYVHDIETDSELWANEVTDNGDALRAALRILIYAVEKEAHFGGK